MSPPDRTPAWIQAILGITLGTLLPVLAAVAGVLFPLTIFHWVGIFLVSWVVNFVSLRFRWTVFNVATHVCFVAGIFILNHFLSR
jgi:hypothetical protein